MLAGMELRNLVTLFLIGSATAFSPGVSPLRMQKAVTTSPMMAGWQDQYSGSAFKEGKKEVLKTKENDFDRKMKEDNANMVGPLATFSAVTIALIGGLLVYFLAN